MGRVGFRGATRWEARWEREVREVGAVTPAGNAAGGDGGGVERGLPRARGEGAVGEERDARGAEGELALEVRGVAPGQRGGPQGPRAGARGGARGHALGSGVRRGGGAAGCGVLEQAARLNQPGSGGAGGGERVFWQGRGSVTTGKGAAENRAPCRRQRWGKEV